LFSRAQAISGRLEAGRRALEDRQALLHDELRAIDGEWAKEALLPEVRRALLGRMESIQNRLSYYSRWSSQLQERIVQLTLP
jgi:hypothetical protein